MPAKKSTKSKVSASTVRNKSEIESIAKVSSPVVKKGPNKIILVGIVLILGVSILLYFFSKWAILAWVDGKPITIIEYHKELERVIETNGGDINQIKDQMIVEKLLQSEASSKGVSVSPNEVNEEFLNIKEQIGTESMKLQLKQFNLTEEDFKKQLETRLIKKKLFGKGVKISNAQVDKYIEEQKALFSDQTGNVPELTNEEKDKLKEGLVLEKIQENFSIWVKDTLNSSRVIKQ